MAETLGGVGGNSAPAYHEHKLLRAALLLWAPAAFAAKQPHASLPTGLYQRALPLLLPLAHSGKCKIYCSSGQLCQQFPQSRKGWGPAKQGTPPCRISYCQAVGEAGTKWGEP